MKLIEIRTQNSQHEFENVELLDQDDQKSWQPNTEDETKKYDVRFTYSWYPAERGSFERGGRQLEPNYAASVEIKKFEVYDPAQKKWLNLDENKYLSKKQLEKFIDELAELG